MPPNPTSSTVAVLDEETVNEYEYKFHKVEDEQEYKNNSYFLTNIIWPEAIGIVLLHLIGVYALLTFPYKEKYVLFMCGKYSVSGRNKQ